VTLPPVGDKTAGATKSCGWTCRAGSIKRKGCAGTAGRRAARTSAAKRPTLPAIAIRGTDNRRYSRTRTASSIFGKLGRPSALNRSPDTSPSHGGSSKGCYMKPALVFVFLVFCLSALPSHGPLGAQPLPSPSPSPEPTATASAEPSPLPAGARAITVPGGTLVMVALTDRYHQALLKSAIPSG